MYVNYIKKSIFISTVHRKMLILIIFNSLQTLKPAKQMHQREFVFICHYSHTLNN